MLGSRFRRADLEIRLNWEPRSYWMLIEDELVSTYSTRGIDLSDPSLETVKDGVWSLCMHACWWRGTPLCSHPMGHTLDAPLWKFNLHW